MMTPGKLLFPILLCSLFFHIPLRAAAPPPERRIIISGTQKVLPGELAVTVLPGSSEVAAFAGKELSSILSERLGFPVPLLDKPADKGRSIILGFNEFTRRAGIDRKMFCRDSFIIRSSGSQILIAGVDDPSANPEKTVNGNKNAQYFERGTLFGAYDFLERFAGVRFYFAGRHGTVIPEKEMTLPEKIDIFDRPDFTIRKLNMETGYFSEKPGFTVRPRNAYSFGGSKHREKNLSGYRLRIQTLLQPNSHGLARLDLAKRFAGIHPEYFAQLDNGKRDIDRKRSKHTFHLCFASGIKNEVFLDARAYLSGRPAAERGLEKWNSTGQCNQIFDVQPQDAFVFCRCGICKTKTPAEHAGKVWDFALDIAEKLLQEKIPGMLQMMAYYPYTAVPARSIPQNMLIQVAVNGPWAYPAEPGQDLLVRSWKAKTSGGIMLWNYCGKWGNGKQPGIPHWTPRRIGQYYRHIAPFITGAYLLCDGDYYLFSALNMYVFAKVAWDNRCDVDALLKEFYQTMFGPAAAEMEQVFNRLEELWLKANSQLVVTATGPLIAPPSEYELFEVYYTVSELQKMAEHFDAAEKKAAGNKKVLERIRFMRWNFLNRIEQAARSYHRFSGAARNFRVPGTQLADGAEPDWNTIDPLYLQRKDGSLIPDTTTVKAALSADTLFFRITCAEPEMKLVDSTASAAPSTIWKQDNVELFLNPSCDRKNYFQIILNSSGVLFAQRGVLTGSAKNLVPVKIPGLKHQVTRDENTTIYTLRIPVSSLPGLNKQLVCNFIRNQSKQGKQTAYTWSPFIKRNNHDLEKAGILDFGAAPVKNLIPDGDFSATSEKKGMSGLWKNGRMQDGISVRYDQRSFVSGSRSLQIELKKTLKGYFAVSIPVKLQRNRQYRLSFYVKLDRITPVGKNGGVNVGIWTGRNRWLPAVRLTGSTPWLRQSMEFSIGEKDRLQGNLNLFVYQCSGTVNFDHLVLEEIK